VTADIPGLRDELEDSLTAWLKDPKFARIYREVVSALDRAAAAHPGPLCIDGREYARRRKARRRRALPARKVAT
jgi:hypothetical protein